MKKGFYIVFEGIVGTGKTTQSKKLHKFLSTKFPHKDILWTREPGGTEIAEAIRKLVQGTKFSEEMNYVCEAYLYAAARAQSLRKVVQPILNQGGIVIQDNSFITSLANQGFGRKLGPQTVEEINKIALGNLLPDIVVYLGMELQKSLKRTFDQDGDKFENLDVSYFKKVKRGYHKISRTKEFKNRWLNVNAEGEIEEVFHKILKMIAA